MLKKTILSLMLLLAAGANLLYSQSFTVATYNVRFDSPNDKGNMWNDRSPVLINLIRFHDFDIFGTQEGKIHQLRAINEALPQYTMYGKGRDDGKEGGEHSVIFFKKERFKLLQSGDFWLSESPDVPGKGWDATCCNRIVSWVQLQDKKSKKKFYVFNAHYDHQGVIARRESSKLMLNKIMQIAGNSPAIMTGDLNGDRESELYKILEESELLSDSYKDVQFPYQNNSSFNSFQIPTRNDVIDHIFKTRHFKATKWGILTDSYYGKFPSDHFPVVATLKFN